MNKNYEVTVKAVRSAAQNCDTLDNIMLEIAVVNPKTLNIDDKIWGFTLNAVNDAIKVPTPSTLRYVALRSIVVDSLAKDKEHNCIVVNGDVDMPLEPGKIVGLEETFVQDEDFAREIADELTAFSVEKATELHIFSGKAEAFLKEQQKEHRY